MPLTAELPPRTWPTITEMDLLFRFGWGTEGMLNVRLGSSSPQKPSDTVVTNGEFSAWSASR